LELCKEIHASTAIPISFEDRYKWIVFLPSKIYPNVGVLNRYYRVMESGKIKARGLEVRRRDTPPFIVEAQTKMLEVFAEAKNATEFLRKILEVLEGYSRVQTKTY
jgi:DNA polymerase-2